MTDRSRPPRVLFLNRSYWPDAEATGQLLTELTEDLAARAGDAATDSPERPFAPEVAVVCGRPNWNPSGARCKSLGTTARHGVTVHRVWHTRWNKGTLRGRAVNFTTFLIGAVLRALFCRRADVVVVETDPFLLAFAGVLLKVRHRAKLVIYAQDVHPELGLAIQRVPDWRSVRLLSSALKRSYLHADKVVTLSRDMRDTFVRFGVDPDRVEIVPNWTCTDAVRPVRPFNPFRERHGLADKFVVMHSGNMGQTQRLETLVDAAARLRDRDDVQFLFVGAGSLAESLKTRAAGLPNVRFLPYEPKEKLAESLSAADLHIVSIDPRAVPYMMPSKLYGILASGTACVAIAPRECELAQTVHGRGVGWVAEPDDVVGLADRIAHLADAPDQAEAAGRAARELSADYDRSVLTARFARMLAGLLDATGGEEVGDDLRPTSPPRLHQARRPRPNESPRTPQTQRKAYLAREPVPPHRCD
ncbi:glycosyltransferase family 4 protein [Alienimonas sp. DA493]|uniref:glycosyltransferase family 4 protein n=1 Tax=Alienimonas sp. DA493 TaxID=3373605 RepID=UPI003754BFF2